MAMYYDDPEQIKRKAQISALTGGAPTAGAAPPTSNTMPVGTRAPMITPQTGGSFVGDTPPPRTAPPMGAPSIGGAPPPRATGGAGGRARSGSAPGGFSQQNWDDPNMQSVKYAAGSFLSGATRPSEVAQIVNSPEFQQRFPGATFNGKDMINFAGAMSDGDSGVPVGMVDVLRSADQGADSSEGFWWGANEAGGDFVPSDGPVAPFGGNQARGNPEDDNSALAQIMKELEALQTGAQSPAERDAIMKMLQGEAV